MPLSDNFLMALSTARRQANLSGRPLSQQETIGIAQGAADTASSQAARLKSLETQRMQQEEMERANRENEAMARRQQLMAERQSTQESRMAGATMGASVGGAIGGAVAGSAAAGAAGGVAGGAMAGSWAGPVGMVIGGAIGYMAGGSYLCGYMHLIGKITDDEMVILNKLRKYSDKYKPHWSEIYDMFAPTTILSINLLYKKHDEQEKYYDNMYEVLIKHIIKHIEKNEMEVAFELYKNSFVSLILYHRPEFKPMILAADRIDKGI